jgi:DNA repair ATPase RecN
MGDEMTDYEKSCIAAAQDAAYNDKRINEEEYDKLIREKKRLEESIKDVIEKIAIMEANREAFNAVRDAIIESTEKILSPPTVFITAFTDTRERLRKLVGDLKKISDDLETTNKKFEDYGQLIEADPEMYDRSAGKNNRQDQQSFNRKRKWFAKRLEEAIALLNKLTTSIPNVTSDKIKSIIMHSNLYDEYDAILKIRTDIALSENKLRTHWYVEARAFDMLLYDSTFSGLLNNGDWKQDIERLLRCDLDIVKLLIDIYK